MGLPPRSFFTTGKRGDVSTETEASPEQIEAVVHPEAAKVKFVACGGKDIKIVSFKRRWQALFAQAVYPILSAELVSTEQLGKVVAGGQSDFLSLNMILCESEMAIDKDLERPAAVVIASTIPGSEKNAAQVIDEQIEWLKDNAYTHEIRAVIEAQLAQEKLVEEVGKRWPARFERSAIIAGRTDVTADSVKQLLNNLWLKSRESIGDGTSTTPRP